MSRVKLSVCPQRFVTPYQEALMRRGVTKGMSLMALLSRSRLKLSRSFIRFLGTLARWKSFV